MISSRARRAVVALFMASSLGMTATACYGDGDASSSAQSAAPQDGKQSKPSNEAFGDKYLRCSGQYPSNNTTDFCGLHLQRATVVEATLKESVKVYNEIDSTQVLNTEPSCAADRCVTPVPANTTVQLICQQDGRYGIVAPSKYLNDKSAVSRYTTSTVGGSREGVAVGFIDYTAVNDTHKVNDELQRKLNARFTQTSCTDPRLIVTDYMHREGWTKVMTPQSR